MQTLHDSRYEYTMQSIATPSLLAKPFSLLTAANATKLYLAPPEMLRRPDVLLWEVTTRPWNEGNSCQEIVTAIPIDIE